MAAKMKITLVGSDPQVTRTIAIPSGTVAIDVVDIIITSLEWEGGCRHLLTMDRNTVNEKELSMLDNYSMTVDDLRGHRLRLIYDDCPGWEMDIIFQKDVESDVPKVLRYKGDSPPCVLAGVRDWNRVNKAAEDPSDPYHDQASAWMSLVEPYDEDSINRIRFTQENVFGKKMKLENLDKVQGVVVRLRENENAEISKNVLIAMLEELLKRDSAEAKKKKLKEQYDIIMDVETERRVNTMCNLSEVVLERGMEQGMVQVAEKMLKANKPAEEIKNFTGVSIDKLKELADKLGVTLN